MARTRRVIAVGATLVAAAGASALLAGPASAATGPTAVARACDAGAWGSRVQGAPRFDAGDAGGDYLWHDPTGFHLRVTHANEDRRVYTGVISSPTPMRVEPVRLERGDALTLSADHRSLYFAFANYGHVDGANFHTDCATSITVSRLNVGNQTLPVTRVYLGEHRAYPARIPFTIGRRDVV
jgi:hypothetical protein